MLEQPDKIEECGRGDAVVENLQENAAQRGLCFDRRRNRRRGHGEKAEHAVAEMIDREVGDHPFQIRLRPGRERGEDDRANRQPKQPRSGDPDFVREKRQQEAHESVNAHFREHAGQNHGRAGRGGFVCVRQPGMKGKERHLDGQPEEDSGEGEPAEFPGQQAVFPECRERGKIKGSPNEINAEKRKQHRDAAEKGVEEKFGRGAVAVRAAPNLDEEEAGDQAHLVKEKPENESSAR